jgi:hypothetical protein
MSENAPPLAAPVVLPEDVLVFPVTDLPADLRAQTAFDPEDFVVTRKNARQPSKVVDSGAAALIETFRTARTLVDGVIAFSGARGLDPRTVLDDAFPLLGELLAAGILVHAASPGADRIQPSLDVGDTVATYVVEKSVQVLDDAEVYRVRANDGAPAALKIARADHAARIAPALSREAALLAHLQGTAAPRLLGDGTHAGRPYLLLEWCEGVPVVVAARRLQSPSARQRSPRLLVLCVAILRAYAALHARGVVHGDVHPNNVLADDDGNVRILDFGLGRLLDNSGPLGAPPRGGAAFYFDPACAAAMRLKQAPPPADALAEQYALAALLREMLAGRPYLDFSVEQDELLRQIVEAPPVAFIRHSVPPWADVELVLSRAFAKEAKQRYSTVSDFADALERAAPMAVSAARGVEPHDLLADVLRRLRPDGAAFRVLHEPSPLCSVNTGAAGAAYALYRIASTQQDAEMLALAELWITHAERHAAGNAGAFYSPELEITPETVGRASLFHSPSGVACVHSLICAGLGDEAAASQAADRFIARSQVPCDRIDLTLGGAGTLLGAAALLAVLPERAASARAKLRTLGNEVARDLRTALTGMPPVGEGSALNLGIAHGWGGILFALLRWQEATGEPTADPLVPARLAELAGHAEPVGQGLRWPWVDNSAGTSATMPGWCNGSAGLVHLWSLAHRTLGHPDYADLATRAAMDAWEEPRGSADLCCGTAGRAYAMLDLYRHTGDGVWHDRARALGNDAARGIAEWSLRRDSLYKGEIGVALLLADLETPELSCMPLFDREP